MRRGIIKFAPFFCVRVGCTEQNFSRNLKALHFDCKDNGARIWDTVEI